MHNRCEWRNAIEQAANELRVELDYSAEIKEGDTYLAKRNGPVRLLTARKIMDSQSFPKRLTIHLIYANVLK